MVKKIIITKDQLNDTKGFEEIMDLVVNENEKLEVESKRRKDDKLNDSYLLYNFLEDESKRLEKLSVFFGTKINNFKNFNQTEHITKKQCEIKNEIKKDLAEYQAKSNSPLNENLSILFNSLF